jgi:hypothetical protein
LSGFPSLARDQPHAVDEEAVQDEEEVAEEVRLEGGAGGVVR